MKNEEADPTLERMVSAIDGFCVKVEEAAAARRRRAEEWRRCGQAREALEEQLATQAELQERLTRLGGRARPVPSAPLAAPTDRARLAHARDMYQIAKELTGIRWDFTAPPDVAKGYVKSCQRRVLSAFEVEASNSAALWAHLADQHDENTPP